MSFILKKKYIYDTTWKTVTQEHYFEIIYSQFS